MELLTFASTNNPIVNNETGKFVAYVANWEGGKVSVCMVGDGDWLTLAGIEDAPPVAGETALQLFLKYREADAAAK